jgi:hypothetical protein
MVRQREAEQAVTHNERDDTHCDGCSYGDGGRCHDCCRNTRTCVMIPSQRCEFGWAWFMVILTVYNVFMLPILAFFDSSVAALPTVLAFDYLVDAFFLSDLILTFYTAFENEWGKLVKDRRVIAIRYLRGIFILDLLGALPWELLVMAWGYRVGDLAWALVRLSRCFRFHRLLNDEVLQSSYVSIRLFRLLISLFMIAHWIGSIFVGISQFQNVVRVCLLLMLLQFYS